MASVDTKMFSIRRATNCVPQSPGMCGSCQHKKILRLLAEYFIIWICPGWCF